MQNEYKHSDLTRQIIKAFYIVYNTLGYGFLESVYRNAMQIELNRMGLVSTKEKQIDVYYSSQPVGKYFADLIVEEKVILEIKSAEHLLDEHSAQLLNYLKATPYEVGLLLNFGPKPVLQRKVFDNSLKGTIEWLDKEEE